jgi:hypothetical protein
VNGHGGDAGAGENPELEGATSLYGVLVLVVAAGLLGTIQIMGSAPPVTTGRVPERVEVPNGVDPLEGLPEPAVARVASSVRVLPEIAFSSPDMFPCTECHDPEDDDLEPREFTLDHKTLRVDHGQGWCFTCHAPLDRDSLRLADGTLVAFTEVEALCGQCHQRIRREWDTGLHGHRSGYWSGAKRVARCADCHNAHAPQFAPLTPLPAPVSPEVGK